MNMNCKHSFCIFTFIFFNPCYLFAAEPSNGDSLSNQEFYIKYDEYIKILSQKEKIDYDSAEIIIKINRSTTNILEIIAIKPSTDEITRYRALIMLKESKASEKLLIHSIKNINQRFAPQVKDDPLEGYGYAQYLVSQNFFDNFIRVYDEKKSVDVSNEELKVISHVLIRNNTSGALDGYKLLLYKMRLLKDDSRHNAILYTRLMNEIENVYKEHYRN